MANFSIALPLTLKNEGFFSDDPSDVGGLTLWGIARNKEPEWDGWAIVDILKSNNNFPDCMKDNTTLLQKRDVLYKTKYWDKVKGDDIINQEVANDLFDKCVNMGVHQAVVLCQRSLDIPETGKMDNTTLNILNTNNPFA